MRERSRTYLEERATSARSRDAVVPEQKVPIGALPAPAEDAISPCTFVTGTVRWFAESRPHPYERYRQRDESDCHNLASHRATLVATPTRMVAVLWQLCGVDPWGARGFTDAPGRLLRDRVRQLLLLRDSQQDRAEDGDDQRVPEQVPKLSERARPR
jgi:hypothetical protein